MAGAKISPDQSGEKKSSPKDDKLRKELLDLNVEQNKLLREEKSAIDVLDFIKFNKGSKSQVAQYKAKLEDLKVQRESLNEKEKLINSKLEKLETSRKSVKKEKKKDEIMEAVEKGKLERELSMPKKPRRDVKTQPAYKEDERKKIDEALKKHKPDKTEQKHTERKAPGGVTIRKKDLMQDKDQTSPGHDPMTSTRSISKQDEREMADKFVKKERGEQEEIDKLMADPELVDQPLDNPICANCQDKADMYFSHSGLFGDDFPKRLYLCKYCEKLLKKVPLAKKESYILLNKLIKLANVLDHNGLYIEAKVIDNIIQVRR